MNTGFSFVTPTFKNVSGGEIDIQDIKCVRSDGSEWTNKTQPATKCLGAITVQKIDDKGNYGQKYSYWSSKFKWCVGETDDSTPAENITLKQGEGLVAYCTKAVALRVSGEVALNDGIVMGTGFSFSGVYIPCDIDIQDLKCLRSDGTEWTNKTQPATKCLGAITIQTIDDKGNYGQKYSYWSSKFKWCVGETDDTEVAENVPLKAGQGFVAYCTKSVMLKLSVNK